MKKLFLLSTIMIVVLLSGCKRVYDEVPVVETDVISTDIPSSLSSSEGAVDTIIESGPLKVTVKEIPNLDQAQLFHQIEASNPQLGVYHWFDADSKSLIAYYYDPDRHYDNFTYNELSALYGLVNEVLPSYDCQTIKLLLVNGQGISGAQVYTYSDYKKTYIDGAIDGGGQAIYGLPYRINYINRPESDLFTPKLSERLNQTISEIVFLDTVYLDGFDYSAYSHVAFIYRNGTVQKFKYDVYKDSLTVTVDGLDFPVDFTKDTLRQTLVATSLRTFIYDFKDNVIIESNLVDGSEVIYPIDAFSFNKVNIADSELQVFEIHTLNDFVKGVGHFRKLKINPDIETIDMSLLSLNASTPYISNGSIHNVRGLLLEGNKDKPIKFTIGDFGNVLAFIDCEDIRIVGLDLGHDEEVTCYGDVIHLNHSTISIGNSILFGSGINGLTLDKASKAVVQDTRIWDCSNSAVKLLDNESTLTLDHVQIDSVPIAFDFNADYYTEPSVILSDVTINAKMKNFYYGHYDERFEAPGLSLFNEDLDQFTMKNVIYSPGNLKNFETIATFVIEQEAIPYVYVSPKNEEGSYNVSVELIYEADLSSFTLQTIKTISRDVPEDLFEITIFFDQEWDITVLANDKSTLLAKYKWETFRKEIKDLKVGTHVTESIFGVPSIDVAETIVAPLIKKNTLMNNATIATIESAALVEGQVVYPITFNYPVGQGDPGILPHLFTLHYNQTMDTYQLERDSVKYDYNGLYTQDILKVLKGIQKVQDSFIPISPFVDVTGKSYVATSYHYKSINDIKTQLGLYMSATMSEWTIDQMSLLDRDGVLYSVKEPYYMVLGTDAPVLPVMMKDGTLEVVTLKRVEEGFDPMVMIFSKVNDEWKLIGVKEPN